MATNKESIVETELVWGPEVITGPKFTKKLRVDEGTNAVITLDGAYRETLPPGGHMLAQFPLFRQCKIHYVDVKDRQLTVESQAELIIQEPAPVPVDLSVVVTYRVIEPRIVALEVSRPIATLFDYTVEAMRDAVKRSKFEDFLVGGNAASLIYRHLMGRDLDHYLGIKVLNVQIASLRGDERVRGLIVEEGIGVREEHAISDRQFHVARREMEIQMEQALNQGKIAEAMRLTPEFVYLTNPQMFEMLYGNRRVNDELRLQGLIELARAGMIDVSAITGSSGDFAQALGRMLTGKPVSGQVPGLPGGAIAPGELISTRERLEQEYLALKEKGFQVTLRQDVGVYYLVVALRDGAGHTLNIYFACTEHYPEEAPSLFVELDGVQQKFDSVTIRNWTYQNTLSQVVHDALTFFE